jgi:hypothetical protein
MKITKTSVQRITAETECGCRSTREFEDTEFKMAVGETPTFIPCKKHEGRTDLDILEMILNESVADEAKKGATVTAPVNPTRPNPAATVDAEGNLVQKTPIVAKITGLRTTVRASGTAVRPGTAPINAAQAARTGPAKAFVRPTASVSTPLNVAPQGDDLSDDLLGDKCFPQAACA